MNEEKYSHHALPETNPAKSELLPSEKRPILLGALSGKFTLSEDFHLPDPELESLFYKDR